MTFLQFIIRSICYHWRTNCAVVLGVIVGTAVIGGALVVGDSVRDSLEQMTLGQLGDIDHSLFGQRFFREQLVDELAETDTFKHRFERVAPVLLMKGTLEWQAKGATLRANRLKIYGVEARLWELTQHGDIPVPVDRGVVLNNRVARQFVGEDGDPQMLVDKTMSLVVELPSAIPRDTLLGERKVQSKELELTVKAVLPSRSGLGRLDLNPNQHLPPNIFLSLEALQELLGLHEQAAVRHSPVAKPARVNALFVQAKSDADSCGETAKLASEALTAALAKQLSLADLSLKIEYNHKFNYLSLQSHQMILEASFEQAAKAAADGLKLRQSPVLVYLANEISSVKRPDVFSMYSVVAGLDFDLCDVSPFGPFESATAPHSFIGISLNPLHAAKRIRFLGSNEIILNEWLASDLKVNQDDEVVVTYHTIDSHGELKVEHRAFIVHDIVKLDHTQANDRGLTPEVRGITDVDYIDDWESPFALAIDRITERDEEYWEQYRATPKAFISLDAAKTLWTSRYGQLTSYRISTVPGKTLQESRDVFEQAFLAELKPMTMGLVFQSVKHDGLAASKGTNNFSGLYFGFSLFLIVSAAILIGLVFRLGIERRSTSIGLLSAVGLSSQQIRRLFLIEGLLVISIGGALGILAAVGYAALMMHGLRSWWNQAVGTQFLELHVEWKSLLAGFGISVVVKSFVVWSALWRLRRLSTRELLTGVAEQALTTEAQRRRKRRAATVATVSLILAVVLLVAGLIGGLIPNREAISGFLWTHIAFFVVGSSFLVASLASLAAWLDSDKATAVRGSGLEGMRRLGLRNAARHRQRSVWTASLIASAAFLIIIVAAARRNPISEAPDNNSGNGGFLLVGESTEPILPDLNTVAGRVTVGLDFDESVSDEKLRNKARDSNELLRKILVMPFRVKLGEEASCLNLYQTYLPTVLGVTPAMIERGGFKFSDTNVERPWELLTEELPNEDGVPVFPVLGDVNTLQYSLKTGIGNSISVPPITEEEKKAGKKPDYKLKVMGMFDGSLFQGVLLMSEKKFDRLYTDVQPGYSFFLIGSHRDQDLTQTLSGGDIQDLSKVLESQLSGFDTELVAVRLANFLAVQNTYLDTFRTLGGLGLLLGTFGLAMVMFRNVLERRSELALLRAVGFQKASLGQLVMWENDFLLLWGLAAGTISALLAMLPHMLSTGGEIPWSAGLTILVVFVVGKTAALLAVSEAVRTPIVPTLRSE